MAVRSDCKDAATSQPAPPSTSKAKGARLPLLASGLSSAFSFKTCARMLSSDWFALLMLLALQLKLMWGIWDFKDISLGDSPSYFQLASEGLESHRVHFAWSPLYTITGAILLHFQNHPLMFTTGMRLILVALITTMVFSIMRRLLPRPAAWLASAWFASLPIYFDTLYEVHLFGCLPTLSAWLTLLTFPGRWGRGSALAIFALGACLIRNELSIPCAIFGACVLVYELVQYRKLKQTGHVDTGSISTSSTSTNETPMGRNETPVRPITAGTRLARYLIPYLVPLLISATIVGIVYERSTAHFPLLSKHFKIKHTLNVCQIYAANYQQRHPEWTNDPWTGYSELMQSTFGKVQVTMGEAIARNPRAMLDYFAWNAHLIPSGLQVLLFNVASGKDNPDYAQVIIDAPKAIALSCLVLAALLAGAIKVSQEMPALKEWLLYRQRYFCVLAMGASACCSLFVMLMQRPRPSYILTLGVSIIALTAFCCWRLVRTLKLRLPAAILPAVMILMVAFASPYYATASANRRVIFDYYTFLAPFKPLFKQTQGAIMLPDHGIDMDLYVIGGKACDHFKYWRSFSSLGGTPKSATELGNALDSEFANYVLFAEDNIDQPSVSDFMRNANSNGWRNIGLQRTPGKRFALFQRIEPVNLFVSARTVHSPETGSGTATGNAPPKHTPVKASSGEPADTASKQTGQP